ncbi:MAG: peptide ABC transporter substrate-binding protein [Nitrospirae bacterium GWD2_57_9]|nr:MAG: peptide ABC transporter substrate-binding protein [Nitrospirae bacterium GWD2_57_9]
MNEPLLEIRDLYKSFPVKSGPGKTALAKAVDGVSLTLARGEAVGLVGESGCGKSTLGRLALRLLEPTSGTILFEGRDLSTVGKEELRVLRRKMQIIFQDPYASLNPRMRIREIVTEPLVIHSLAQGKALEDRAVSLLAKVGLPADALNRYPHEFSGGQRQRVGIARALASDPLFIVADEPVSALDVSVQAQIINLLEDLREELGLSFLFIAHDLNVVRHFSDRVAVMYLGRIVEIAQAEDIYRNPSHPYTEALLADIPVADPTVEKKHILLKGDIPSPISIPPACRFHTRCIYRFEPCDKIFPRTIDLGNGHFAECHLRDEAVRTKYL